MHYTFKSSSDHFVNTTKSIAFSLNGPPHGKKAPVRASSHGRTYNPSKQYQDALHAALVLLCKKENVSWGTNNHKFEATDAIEASIQMLFPRPKTHFTRSNKILKEQFASRLFLKKPDVDNVCKFVLDAFKGYLYKDDSQIVKCNLVKAYDNKFNSKGKLVICFKKVESSDDLFLDCNNEVDDDDSLSIVTVKKEMLSDIED